MTKSTAQLNREMAEALMGDGMAKRDAPPRPTPFPEIALQRQIEDTKRRGLETGQDMKPRLLKLRMQHRNLTGEDGG